MSYISPWIFTTTKCNLACPYCYVKQDGQEMNDETYKKMNELFLNMIRSKEKNMVIYRLAGGEPLLMFDKWKKHIEYFLSEAKEHGFVSIITNMTILTEEMLSFFQQSNIGFGISLDGFSYSKPTHDGKSTAEIVKQNIDKLLAHNINNIDISTVIDKNSFSDIEQLAEWIAKRDLNWGIYLDHFFCGEIDCNLIIEKMMNVIDILNKYHYDFYNKLKFNNIKINSLYEGCTAGEKLITIFVNGDIYPCQTTIYKEKICNIFDTKNLIEDLKNQKYYKLGYNFTLPEKCKDCAIADICGGGCKENNKEINKNYTCDIMKAVLLYMMKAQMKKEDKKDAKL